MLINGTFKKKSYELIRDLFIFCCFSGLSWRDMYNLTTDNLQTSFDGHLWIKTNRQKTGTETNIRLLDTAKHIIEKYQGMAEGNKLLPVPCYANCRHGIKAVAKLCGIQKNVCWHQSRHSYTYPTLKANIKAIYKSGILNEYEAQKCIKQSDGNNIDVYSLPLIVALSFRLDTLGAYKMREYIINKLTTNPKTDIVFVNMRTHECMNESKYRHN